MAYQRTFSGASRFSAKTALLSLLVASTALLTACGEKAEDRQIASGLACLDSASTTTDANTCLDKVQGLETPQAYLIRCSANFIAQGVTGKRIADAFQKLKDTSGTSTQPTTALMAYMVFRSDAAYARHTADITFNNCKVSGVQGMIGLASIAKTAAVITGAITAGSGLDPTNPATFTPTALASAVTAAYNANDPAKNAAIGDLAATAQSVYCGTGSGFKDQDLCVKLNAAISSGGTNTADIGRSLLNLLKQ